MNRIAWLLFAATLTVGDNPTPQDRADFSGTWSTADGSSLTLRQDEKTLTVTEGAATRIYNLDGSESRFDGPVSERDRSRMTAQARWVGSALVVATTTVSPIGTWQDLEVYSLDYGPKLSVVEVGAQTTRGMMYTTLKTYAKK